MKKFLLTLVCLFTIVGAFAQSASITGSIKSAQDKSALPGASVLLVNSTTNATVASVTDVEGNFRFERVATGNYTIKVNYLGFNPFSRNVKMEGKALSLGALTLEEASTAIGEVEIIGRAPLGEQKGDTAQFNAKAFKTAPDASAEELVTKMPGVTIQDGKIQAQGEEVKQVMIDGKRYTGEDVSSAVRNISADMIESVQVFDGQSDRAAFSGFDDGNRVKTLNFTTKKDRRQGYMGKISAGYGTDERYMVGAAVSYYNGPRRITITGLTNNINMSDFSVGETPGGGMRGRRVRFGGGGSNGISNTNMFSINFNDMLGKKIEVSGNYNYSNADVNNNQYRFRDFINTDTTYLENSIDNDIDDSHRFNLRFQYNINENNRLLVTPSISVQNTDALSNVSAYTVDNAETASAENLTESLTRNQSENSNINFRNNILYSHRFGDSGRILTTNFSTNYSTTNGDTYQLEDTDNLQDPTENVNRNQLIKLDRDNLSWEGNVDYSQRLGANSRLQLEYNIGNQTNDSDRRTYDFDETAGRYNSNPNAPLSNTFQSDYLSQTFGPSYQYRSDKSRFQANIRYQIASLESDVVYPESYPLKRNFNSILPSAEYEYKFSESSNINFNFRSNTNAPSVSDLQEVLDISRPTQLRIGNSALDQDYQNRINIRYRNFNAETNRVFFVGMFGTITQNYVANSVYTRDIPAEFIEGYNPQPGARLNRPVNMDGYYNVRSFMNYGQPLNFISSNFNAFGMVGFERRPGMLDEKVNYANTTNLGAGINISSNISEKVDFTISTNSNYNIVKNTLLTQDNNYFTQTTNLRYNWILLKGLVYRTELNHVYNSGLSQGVDPSYILWNMSLGKKVFKNQQGEISFSVNDVLGQNVSVQRNVATDYIEDVQSTVLQRFFMVTFTYNLKKFASGSAPEENNNRGNWGPGRGR
ncbi:TonB-dependent receptor [Pontibacter sp. BT310]|uniref:Outer membrane beta-barrel protein n=1 Tax=Pontibacter populi TaxID=890055 RepID=A0ABS6XF10_9BACT|nr:MULTISPECIES: TonB-dependent receptor [Pontibacter]MBJ6119718.1 TonB-dependent receptor [Pontibacter sp. BT310]MBR0572147.1 TonB-dependent receptor [Microvirga sp. STS03]MBW3366571.1 outer membrane beta-barrel protein [Pontibacter populi]